ncbi:hypothetical protein T12_187 [Trichinella patagoniensis]|uniref:Uncharacterized protein n=1 Tax=Trichinella patagoniensis TaxID=990121 RepID=A0A0V0ZP55_9BILA|nr:hypothetical protein T12_187 [Trichinella patagoniensis]
MNYETFKYSTLPYSLALILIGYLSTCSGNSTHVSARHRANFNPCYSTLPRIIVTTKWMREEYLLCY